MVAVYVIVSFIFSLAICRDLAVILVVCFGWVWVGV